MTADRPSRFPLSSEQRHAVSASFLGWTLDAFDFFVLVFLVDVLAEHFHVPPSKIIFTTALTLGMRPLGALIFGLLADRYGRRTPLMANVVFFSVVELLCGFAPNYTVFLILRAIYGIGMGGEWAWELRSPWRACRQNGAERFQESCNPDTPAAICWRPWPRRLSCRCGAGARCFGQVACPRCWRSISATR